MADLGVQATYFRLDVLRRPHESADRAGLLGQLVEECGVHIVADAERENARVGRVPRHHVFHDPVHIRLTNRRHAVGEEDDCKRSARIAAAHLQRSLQRVHPLFRVL